MHKRRFMVAALLLVTGILSIPAVFGAVSDSDSLSCRLLGALFEPLGYCKTASTVTVITTDTRAVPTLTESISHPEPAVAGTSTSTVMPEVLSSTAFVVQANSDLALDRTEEELADLLTYLNSMLLLAQRHETLPEQEYVLKSLDRVYDKIGDVKSQLVRSGEFTDPTFIGTAYVEDMLGIGTTSPTDVLSVAGAVYLASITPTHFSNRLYNVNGDLYWNGTILSGSSTANWSALSGDVFRLTGSVGIGTSTPSDTLTVAGTFSAGTTTARIVDTGGQVCNVEAYGAVGDNSTINDAAIAAAIAACGEGGTVFFPMGEYRIASPIVLDRPITLRGAYSPRWSYSSTPRSSIRADFGTFSGTAMIHVRDRSISGETDHNNGGRLEYLSLDGGSASTGVNGVYFEGLVRDWKLTDVDISQVSGNGFEAAVGSGSGNPRGFTIRGLSIYSADGHGFRATALNDSYIEDLLTVGNALRGIYLSSMGETKINNSRAVFNGLTGLYIDGASSNGGLMFTDFSTDRNDRHGVRISLTGTTTVTFNGLLTRRDGPNTSGGSETPYAGVAIIGTTSEQVAPVFINGLSQIIGVDDSGNPPLAPLTGVRVANASYVKVEGQLWGVNEAYRDDGGNDSFIIEEGSIIKVGNDGVTEAAPPLYHNKWIASSTVGGLVYNGKINIGSSTDSRLLNIVAPAGAGARFRDTTNNVTFDMRAEDYQGFFGTFSNHQLRFQTNNTSRLTIDTNGYIGIGTTSPTANLHVTGTVRLGVLGSGTVLSDANGNLSVSSDERLKLIEDLYVTGLAEVLELEPITYHWNEFSGMDMETLYAGFSAQNVQEYIPEAVGEDARGLLTLSDRPILAAVVNAIKEVWQVVTGNQARIAELEERLATVEAQLQMEVVDIHEEEPSKEDVPEVEPPATATTTPKTNTATTTEAVTEDETDSDEVADEEQESNKVEMEEEVEDMIEEESAPAAESETVEVTASSNDPA